METRMNLKEAAENLYRVRCYLASQKPIDHDAIALLFEAEVIARDVEAGTAEYC